MGLPARGIINSFADYRYPLAGKKTPPPQQKRFENEGKNATDQKTRFLQVHSTPCSPAILVLVTARSEGRMKYPVL